MLPLEDHDQFSVQLTPPSIANAPPIATTTVAYVNQSQPSRKHENTNQRSDLEAELSLLYEFRDLLLSTQQLGDVNLIVVKCSHHKTTADTRSSASRRVQGPWVVPDPGPPLPPPPPPVCPHPSVHIRQGSPEWQLGWTTTKGLATRSNSWADYTQTQSAYDEYHRAWQEKKDAYDAFQLLNIRAHMTVVLWFRPAGQGGTGQPPPRCYATYHLYSNRDHPRYGLQTYTYVPYGKGTRRQDAGALSAATTNACGMVGPDGRIG